MVIGLQKEICGTADGDNRRELLSPVVPLVRGRRKGTGDQKEPYL
jgi:hypothetical protein